MTAFPPKAELNSQSLTSYAPGMIRTTTNGPRSSAKRTPQSRRLVARLNELRQSAAGVAPAVSQPAAEKSIGTRERESAVARRAAHHLPKTRTPPESRGGVVSGTLMYGLWGDCWRAPLGEQMGAPEVPHG